MPFPPLDAWDEATLDEVCTSDEMAVLERKAAPLFDVATGAGRNQPSEHKHSSFLGGSGQPFLFPR